MHGGIEGRGPGSVAGNGGGGFSHGGRKIRGPAVVPGGAGGSVERLYDAVVT